jgi:hypothetical protein
MDNRIDDETLEILGYLQYMRIVIDAIEAQVLDAQETLPAMDLDG